MNPEHVLLINSQSELRNWTDRLTCHGQLALDVEANSLHVYPEQLCLVQLRTPEDSAVVDMLSGLDFSPLLQTLQNSTLILHGADYDLRLLFHHLGLIAGDLFDTMPAARLCGFRSFSLTDLVFHFFNVRLDKSLRRIDWAIRPLTGEMLQYAQADTQYLLPLAGLLQKKLIELGRLEWHAEFCRRLIAQSQIPSDDDPETCWRIRGSGHLSRIQLTMLRELWYWRKKKAIVLKRPPYFVLSHETLILLAVQLTSPGRHGDSVSSLLAKYVPAKWLQEVSQVFRSTNLSSSEDWPQRITGKLPARDVDTEQRLSRLIGIRDRQAVRLNIDPTLISGKALLARLAKDWDAHQTALMNWQRKLLMESTG